MGCLYEGRTCWAIRGCLLTKLSTSSGRAVDVFRPRALRPSVIHCRWTRTVNRQFETRGSVTSAGGRWLCVGSASRRASHPSVHLSKGMCSFSLWTFFKRTSAHSAKKLSCSKNKTPAAAPFCLLAMLKLSPIKCWSDTTLEDVPRRGSGCLTKPLSPKLQAEINQHENWFQKPKLIVLRVSSLRLSLTLFIVSPHLFPHSS